MPVCRPCPSPRVLTSLCLSEAGNPLWAPFHTRLPSPGTVGSGDARGAPTLPAARPAATGAMRAEEEESPAKPVPRCPSAPKVVHRPPPVRSAHARGCCLGSSRRAEPHTLWARPQGPPGPLRTAQACGFCPRHAPCSVTTARAAPGHLPADMRPHSRMRGTQGPASSQQCTRLTRWGPGPSPARRVLPHGLAGAHGVPPQGKLTRTTTCCGPRPSRDVRRQNTQLTDNK